APLMKHVVDDIHSRRQVRRKRRVPCELAKAFEIAAAISVQVALGVRDDHAQHSAGLEDAKAVVKKHGSLLPRVEMFDELLRADARGGGVRERQRPAAVPPNPWRRAEE